MTEALKEGWVVRRRGIRNGYREIMPALFRKVGQLAGEEGREAVRDKK